MSVFANVDEVKDGFEKCHKIINRLLSDAELLLKNGRFSSAVSLAILASEEVGKGEFLRKKALDCEGLTKKEWREISFGGKSHLAKLRAIADTKMELDKEYSAKGKATQLPKTLSKLGIQSNPNVAEEIQYTKYLFEKIFPAFNLVKQDCFYLNWNGKSKKWIYFENRFDDKTKKEFANFLIKETRHNVFIQKLMFRLPDKPFKEFTPEDWQKFYGSKEFPQMQELRRELASSEHNITKKIVFSAIEKHYPVNDFKYDHDSKKSS